MAWYVGRAKFGGREVSVFEGNSGRRRRSDELWVGWRSGQERPCRRGPRRPCARTRTLGKCRAWRDWQPALGKRRDCHHWLGPAMHTFPHGEIRGSLRGLGMVRLCFNSSQEPHFVSRYVPHVFFPAIKAPVHASVARARRGTHASPNESCKFSDLSHRPHLCLF
jgi:hypothetical protein